MIIEPWHLISNKCGILTSLDSDELVRPPFKLRNSKWCSVSSSTVIEYSSDKQWLWPDCTYAQAGLSFCLSHIPHCWKAHVAAHIACYSVIIFKRVTIGLPVKRHLNGVSLAGGWWPDFSGWLGKHLKAGNSWPASETSFNDVSLVGRWLPNTVYLLGIALYNHPANEDQYHISMHSAACRSENEIIRLFSCIMDQTQCVCVVYFFWPYTHHATVVLTKSDSDVKLCLQLLNKT